ncbi:MAG TPA: hypothetical protein VGH19_24145 [Verrucomicrobiae bacterium]
MKTVRISRRAKLWLVVFLPALALFLYLTREEVVAFDINSGRIQRTCFIGGWKVRNVIEETALSRLLETHFGPSPEPCWRLMKRVKGSTRVSPGNGLTNIPTSIAYLEQLLAQNKIHAELQKVIVKNFLTLATKHSSKAMDYVISIRMFTGDDSEMAYTVSNVPDWVLSGENFQR